MNKLAALRFAFQRPLTLLTMRAFADDANPAWRFALVPPHWARVTMAVGPLAAMRIYCDPHHAVHRKRAIHLDPDARAAYVAWMRSLSTAQRHRYFWSLPRTKWSPRPTARVIRPLQFHPEEARLKAENDAIAEWALKTGRDPVQCPIFLERVRRVRERLSRSMPAAND